MAKGSQQILIHAHLCFPCRSLALSLSLVPHGRCITLSCNLFLFDDSSSLFAALVFPIEKFEATEEQRQEMVSEGQTVALMVAQKPRAQKAASTTDRDTSDEDGRHSRAAFGRGVRGKAKRGPSSLCLEVRRIQDKHKAGRV